MNVSSIFSSDMDADPGTVVSQPMSGHGYSANDSMSDRYLPYYYSISRGAKIRVLLIFDLVIDGTISAFIGMTIFREKLSCEFMCPCLSFCHSLKTMEIKYQCHSSSIMDDIGHSKRTDSFLPLCSKEVTRHSLMALQTGRDTAVKNVCHGGEGI